jgi:RecB family exonuclease
LLTIYQKLRVSEELGELETEFAYHSLKHLIQLEEQIQQHHRQLEPRTLARLVIQAFEQATIPFSGEPTKGLQLMGFLETRALDFERVILVSVNEGKLPRGVQHNSYIPYAMRKAFHLPTFEEQDAIFAYHFKRVIQRARHVTILYNTQVAVDGSGEKSRFLWQLQETFPKESIREAIYQMSMPRTMVKAELHIEKSSQILSLMGNYLSGSKVTKPLSPTAFRHYLDCSLRFYFRYIVKLREREQTSKELDARDFGNIVHKALEKIYQPYLDKMVTNTDVRKLMDSQAIAKALDWSMKIHFRKTVFPVLEGKDILHEQIMQKLIFRVLENDLKATPFHLVATELKISGALEFRAGSTVLLEGTLDRVHLANEILHIVDYKTGRADLKNLYRPAFPEKGAEYVQTHFDEPRFKSGFQGLFYGYLWSGDRGYAPLKLGVYPLKKVNEGIQWLNHDRVIPMDGFSEFERQLKQVLQELFDESVPFTQTDDIDRCRYCAYKEICQR